MKSSNECIYVLNRIYGIIERPKKKEQEKKEKIVYDIIKVEEQGHSRIRELFKLHAAFLIVKDC